jgi:radical SAM superfamily enzyme YgiQ (UPF0313 family)
MVLTREPPVYRPPSEADSLILQVTEGCSHNRCTFCSMYRTKSFRAITLTQIRAEISEARRLLGPDVPRVFLADGDAMCLSARRLTEILDALDEAFPRLRRVGTYANARDVLGKSDGELDELRRRKLGILYVGLESGDDATLAAVEKGATVAEMIEAGRRARAAGMAVSVMVQVGLAGRERSLLHARLSAEAVNRMEPTYTALLTYTPTPDSPLFERVGRGEFELPGPLESLEEIREFVRGLSCRTYLTCNHPSNYLPLEGRMPSAQRDILLLLEGALAGHIQIRPEYLRGV